MNNFDCQLEAEKTIKKLKDRIKDLTNWKINACYRIAELETQVKHLESQVYGGTTK